MARIRTIKPELAAHEGLFDLERETDLPMRFAWCMLFTVADRDGRFVWRPRTLKAQILPHDDVDFSRVLHAWLTRGFVRKYRVGNEVFGWIPTFQKHQVINNREAPSGIPSIEDSDEELQELADAWPTRESRDDDACPTREVHAQGEGRKEGKGKEGREGKDCTAGSKRTAPAVPEWLVQFKAIYPKRAGDQNWRGAERAWHARIAEGHTEQEMLEGARRYAEFIRHTGKERTEFVKQAATFLGPSKAFLEPWHAPATKADVRLSNNLTAAEEFMRRTEPTP